MSLEVAAPGLDGAAVVRMLDDVLVALTNVENSASIHRQVDPDETIRTAAERAEEAASGFRFELLQSSPLLAALERAAREALDAPEARVVELVLLDMKRAGARLDPAARRRATELRRQVTALSQEYTRNIRDDVRSVELAAEEVAGMPADYVAAHAPGADGTVRVTTDPPELTPYLRYGKSERARRELVLARANRAVPANLDVLARLRRARHELATVLGYASWADYMTEDKMVGSAAGVARFIAEARDAAREAARAEAEELLVAKRRDDPSASFLGTWDRFYYLERLRERAGLDPREARPYFEYHAVRKAIFDLSADLFGMAFTRVEDPETWHPSVESFDVTMDGRAVGRISLDMHPRRGKYKHFQCAMLRTGVRGRQLPHVVLICNFPDPAASDGPALLDHAMVVTYFHEFGHLAHCLARADVPLIRLSRASENDFAEAPSTILEEWFFDHEVLRRFARHVETGEPIPERIVKDLRAADELGRGLRVNEILYASELALRLHDGDPSATEPTALAAELEPRHSFFRSPPGAHYEAAWEHLGLDQYSAGYYTYPWSWVIAKDMESAFVDGLMDLRQARRYRDLVLAPGGSKPAAELVRDFLGRPYGVDAFRRWLTG